MTRLFLVLSIMAAPTFAYGNCKCTTTFCNAVSNVLQSLTYYGKPAALPPGRPVTQKFA